MQYGQTQYDRSAQFQPVPEFPLTEEQYLEYQRFLDGLELPRLLYHVAAYRRAGTEAAAKKKRMLRDVEEQRWRPRCLCAPQ